MVVGGFIPSAGTHRGGLGALLVGAYDTTGELRYCGHVGTGMSQRTRTSLVERLTDLQQPLTPFATPIPDVQGARWVRPTVVVDIEYRQFTGRLRHPALKGVLLDADSAATLLPDQV